MKDNTRISLLLSKIYNPDIATTFLDHLESILAKYRKQIVPHRIKDLSERDILLITYPDQVREPGRTPLQSLNSFCEQYLTGLITGIHILPFYPSSSDDGFSVIDYRAVDPKYGSWTDISAIGRNFRLMFDAVINHTSIRSNWFKGFLEDDVLFNDYYIEVQGTSDLSKVIRPRTLPLLTHFTTAAGTKAIWTTFSSDQADLNYHNPEVLMEVIDILLFYVRYGAEFIRLDAIAYLWKEIGTNCINLSQTHWIVQLIRAILDEISPQVMLITETNVPQEENLTYFGNGSNEAQFVYNFTLPPLVLHAFQTGSAGILSRWAAELKMPSKNAVFFNFLASHDGVGLNPLRGILPEIEIERLANDIEMRGGLISYKTNADGSQSPYEVNVNYLDALTNPGEPVETNINRFITAHAILLAFAGMPGIYFHSLFGSQGWPEGVAQTGRNRTINREKLNRSSLQIQLENNSSLRSMVFVQISNLMRVRANHSAFAPYGIQRVLEIESKVFALLRLNADTGQQVLCLHNMSIEPIIVDVDFLEKSPSKSGLLVDLISGEKHDLRKSLLLPSYQAFWLTDLIV